MKIDEVVILGWESEGLRCPDVRIDLQKSRNIVHRVSLIQMPNGTGKTTTLALLRALLSGRSPTGTSWEEYDIAELAKRGGGKKGKFVVHLLHNKKPLSFQAEFDFEAGKVALFTTGQSGENIGFDVPRLLEQFLNPNFVRFFVFDGELAAELTDANQQDAEQAIEALFQINNFNAMGDWAQEYLEDRIDQQRKSEGSGKSTEHGIKQQRTSIRKISERLKVLEARQAELVTFITKAKEKITALKNENREAISGRRNFKERYNAANKKLENAKLRTQVLTSDLLAEVRNPHKLCEQFAAHMLLLKNSFDRVKLPENTAREWFEELAEEENCVCGRALDEPCRTHIRTQSQRYLGSDNIALLNRIKGAVANEVGDVARGADQHLCELVSALVAANDEVGVCQHAVERIVNEAGEEDPEIEQRETEIKDLEAKLLRWEDDERKFRQPDRSLRIEDCWNIVELTRRKKAEEDKLDEITKTAALRWKVEELQQICVDIHKAAIAHLGTSLADAVNASLEELMPYNHVRLKGVSTSLKLEGKRGASIGETLTVAYAFLTRLGHRSNYRLPLVIDTPAAPIDDHIRREVGEALPKLVNQFIAFTISPERGPFIDALLDAAEGDVQFLTLFRKSNTRLAKTLNGTKAKYSETADGVVVEGHDYFDSFQDDSKYERATAAKTKR